MAEAGARLLDRDLASSQGGIFLERTFDVHGKGQGQAAAEQGLDDVGPQAVAVHFDRQAKVGEAGQGLGDARNIRGLAARDHHAVQPAAAAAQVVHDLGLGNDRQGRVVLGQFEIVAGGAGHVATGEKDHAGSPSGPVAETQGLEALQQTPGKIRHCRLIQVEAERLVHWLPGNAVDARYFT